MTLPLTTNTPDDAATVARIVEWLLGQRDEARDVGHREAAYWASVFAREIEAGRHRETAP